MHSNFNDATSTITTILFAYCCLARSSKEHKHPRSTKQIAPYQAEFLSFCNQLVATLYIFITFCSHSSVWTNFVWS